MRRVTEDQQCGRVMLEALSGKCCKRRRRRKAPGKELFVHSHLAAAAVVEHVELLLLQQQHVQLQRLQQSLVEVAQTAVVMCLVYSVQVVAIRTLMVMT